MVRATSRTGLARSSKGGLQHAMRRLRQVRWGAADWADLADGDEHSCQVTAYRHSGGPSCRGAPGQRATSMGFVLNGRSGGSAPIRRPPPPRPRTGRVGRPLAGHHARVRLRVRDAVDDGLGERRQTAIAPQPVAAREVGPQRRALGIRSVAPCARRATHVAVEDPIAERDLRGRGPGGRRQ